MPSPYNLISQGKGNFAAARSAGRSDKSDKPLTREEVLYCGELVTLALTHFKNG